MKVIKWWHHCNPTKFIVSNFMLWSVYYMNWCFYGNQSQCCFISIALSVSRGEYYCGCLQSKLLLSWIRRIHYVKQYLCLRRINIRLTQFNLTGFKFLVDTLHLRIFDIPIFHLVLLFFYFGYNFRECAFWKQMSCEQGKSVWKLKNAYVLYDLWCIKIEESMMV